MKCEHCILQPMGFILIILALLFGNLFLNQKRQDKLEDYKRKLAEKDKE